MDDLITKADLARTITRLRAGHVRAHCARVAGIPRSAWSRYEGGKQMAKAETRAKIARGLDVTPRIFEDELLKTRKQRLREEDNAKAQSALPPSPDDPLRRALTEGLQNKKVRLILDVVGYFVAGTD